ncbi:hypothetical protein KCG44_05480 [Pacificimonas sp. WHA3]|uniref:Phage shock protein B n=1 Tax=Pacificimonas pallii TaxID=2827236 RepID=A0ABS6SDR2_9SPHN|nr:hypothetical protein [Pacificimonas pallii]MBV7256233.1 hypothetical protein [Pacificimonas pallii]
MGSWSAAVLIVLIAMVGGIIMKRQRRADEMPAERGEKQALKTEIMELKQRIETLERIATDKTRRLSDQIDALDDNGKD